MKPGFSIDTKRLGSGIDHVTVVIGEAANICLQAHRHVGEFLTTQNIAIREVQELEHLSYMDNIDGDKVE